MCHAFGHVPRALCDEGSAAGTGHSRAALAARAIVWVLPLVAVTACGTSGGTRTDPHASSSTTRPHVVRKLPTGAPPPRSQRDCFERPSACGYPDPSNTGVPPGTPLNSYEGDLRVTTPGTVISDVSVKGTVEIMASNVTIRDSEVTTTDGNDGHNIWIGPGAGNVVIESTTLRGADAHANAVQYGVQNSGETDNKGIDLQMYNCTECWAGPGTLEDSYAISDGVVTGAHYENIYYGGGGGSLIADHDTLLNPHDQTANVFTKTDFGDVDTVTVTNNLMAGGGFMVYGGEGGIGSVVGPVTVTGNRFARCATAPVADRGGGHYCAQGPDVHGYWPEGGHYGVAGAFNGPATTWKDNYWDDSGDTASSG